jgi:IS5 family transposase
MFRTVGDRPSSWESRLPAEVLRLPDELARVGALLDDPAFFEPFRPYFHPVIGRPSTPVECYLRLMFLKFRYRLGMRACARRSAIRSRGGGSAGSRLMARCRIPRR